MSDKHKLQRDKRTGNYFVRFQVDGIRKRFTLGKTRDAARSALRKTSKHPTCAHIFVAGNGQPYTCPTFRQRFQRWCERAGIPVPVAVRVECKAPHYSMDIWP